ncbi:peptidase domain-containing ABC transporter [Lacinutrix sp. 5H-3-7-4]|uniref:peptidase domain-containing ABC transporter n=1 Tax=Lacinutrix sp. (strain 5H-3-7-4) TaxID=983544 RepID=UPI00020A33EE|nr:ATP-binding cassette domain-containing protein [Lacinutrix sp. 5H-3-7-4]AEH02374.1 Xenobiotic-transporting ATPase [Lacinutrix sp. 5H-3-7-4]
MAKTILTTTQRLIGLLKLDKKDIKQIFFYAIFAGIVSLSLPLGIQAIINLLQSAQISTSWMVLVGLVTLGVVFVGVLQLMQIRIIENVQQKIFTRSSFEFAYRFPKMTMKGLNGSYAPELANRFFDTLTIQKGLSKILIEFPAALLQIIFGLILLSFYHPFFIIYGFLLLLLVYIVFKFTAQKGLETSLEESNSKYKVAHWLQEVARSILSFKLSGKTNLAMHKNDRLVTNYLEEREKHFNVLILQFMQLVGFKVLVTAGLLIIGGLLVLNQKMNIGQFVAAEIIILLVIASVEKLILGLETIYDVLTSIEKLGKIVDKPLESQEGEILKVNNEFHLELDDISYSVPDREDKILDNISLEIKPKQTLLITGQNGSGKSTLLKLIAGLIKPTSGKIYINNKSLLGININSYRSFIGQTLAQEMPFEGTLLENITFGDTTITLDQVNDVIKNLGLKDYVKSLPLGLKTMLYPEGKGMSFTISKKIMLARSVVKKPKLLLLKEPLDQFEAKEAQDIIQYLTLPSHDWTLVVVSHNNIWLPKANNVIELNEGRIINKK